MTHQESGGAHRSAAPGPDPDTVREEAERLVAAGLAAVSMVADRIGAPSRERGGSVAAGYDALGDMLFGQSAHRHHSVANDSPECCRCPVCRVISAAREPNPNAAERLATGVGTVAEGAARVLRGLAGAAGSVWDTRTRSSFVDRPAAGGPGQPRTDSPPTSGSPTSARETDPWAAATAQPWAPPTAPTAAPAPVEPPTGPPTGPPVEPPVEPPATKAATKTVKKAVKKAPTKAPAKPAAAEPAPAAAATKKAAKQTAARQTVAKKTVAKKTAKKAAARKTTGSAPANGSAPAKRAPGEADQ